MSYLDRIREANDGDPNRFIPFMLGDWIAGAAAPDMVAALLAFPGVFVRSGQALTLVPSLHGASCEARTGAVHEVMVRLRDAGVISGWRDEMFAVARHFGAVPELLLERAAVPALGVRGYGVHVNGFVCQPDGLHMWIGRRASDKPTWPDRLDQIVAGGQPAGIGVLDNLVKECGEEAGIPAALARRARSVGTINYRMHTVAGLRPGTIFVFDLELPQSFEPVNRDGEVAYFECLPIERVMQRVCATREFKANCALVIIDFLIRHGFLTPHDDGYEAIAAGLHQR